MIIKKIISKFILIFLLLVIVLVPTISYNSVLFIIHNLNAIIEKKLNLKKFEIENFNVKLNVISFKKFNIELDENKSFDFTDCKITVSYKTLLSKSIKLNSIDIGSFKMKYKNVQAKEEHIDTEPLDLKKLFLIPATPIDISAKNINVNINRIEYSDSTQYFELNNIKPVLNFTYIKDKLNLALDISDINNNIFFSMKNNDIKIHNSSMNLLLNYKKEQGTIVFEINTKFSYINDTQKIQVAPCYVHTKSTINLNLKNIYAKMNLTLDAPYSNNIFNMNSTIECNYDSSLNNIKFKIDEFDLDLSDFSKIISLPAFNQYKNYFNFGFKVSSGSANIDFIKKNICIDKFNFSCKNINLKEKFYCIDNLNLNLGLNSNIDFDSFFNISPGSTFDLTGNISSNKIEYDTLVSAYNFNTKLFFNKSKNPEIIIQTKNILKNLNNKNEISKSIMLLLDNLDTCNITVNSENIEVFRKYKFYDFTGNLFSYKNMQNINISSDWNSFEFTELDTPFFIPSGKINIGSSINGLNRITIKAALSLKDLLISELEGICEYNENIILKILNNKFIISDFFDKIFMRVNSENRINLAQFKYLQKDFNPVFDGNMKCDFIVLKNSAHEPVFNAMINFDNVNIIDKNNLFKIINMNLELPVKDILISKIKPSKNIDEEIEIPDFPVYKGIEKNLFIKNIQIKDIDITNTSANISANSEKILLKDFAFDFLGGQGLVNFLYDLQHKNIGALLKINDIDISYITKSGKLQNSNLISGIIKLKLKNLYSNNRIIDINNIDADLFITKINKETIFEILNWIDPQNLNPDFASLRTAVKLAKPVSAKFLLHSGILRISIKFDSQIISEFTIDRIQLNKLKIIKDMLK